MKENEKDIKVNIVKMSEIESYSLSIILPVFNVEKYLDRCIKSILEGDFKDFEIIIVNDGTKDNSAEILNRYLENNDNITYIVKENGGLSHARNVRIYVFKRKIYSIF